MSEVEFFERVGSARERAGWNMKRLNTGRRGRRAGMAMLYAVFGVFAAATMVSVTMTMANSSHRQSQAGLRSTRAKYLAEGAIELAKRDVSTAIANWQQPPANGVATLGGVDVPYTVVATGFNNIATDPAGIQTIVTGYEIRAQAEDHGMRYTARRLVNAEATPIFQFAVFYTGDLEINPGPNMTLGGRVHSNADMYLNCGGTLTMNTNYVRAVGDIFRRRKDDPNASEGTVRVRRWVVNPFDSSEPTQYVAMNSHSQMNNLGVANESGYDSAFKMGWDANGNGSYADAGDWYNWAAGAPIYWSQPSSYNNGTGSSVLSGSHGVGEAAVPHIGSIRMYDADPNGAYYFDPASQTYELAAAGAGTHSRGYYHANAGLTIITQADGSITAYDSDGDDVTAAIAGALSTDTLYDTRQAEGGAGEVPITKIDLSALAATAYWPDNGLIYAAHYGAGTGANAKGVQLFNGAELASSLTVVSENPVYIQGNYNTVNKKGSAVIADAVNLLSNNWNNSKAQGSGLPTATNTTYNVAIITGNTNTTPNGRYNGGLENLPRFHENWNGVTCRITGSFVNTWNSVYADSDWAIGGSYYRAPTRTWSYDTAFNTVANLPPFTPMAVTAVDVCSW